MLKNDTVVGRNMRAYLLSLLMITVSLAGCISSEHNTTSGIGDTTENDLILPEWQIGDQCCTLSLLHSLEKTVLA